MGVPYGLRCDPPVDIVGIGFMQREAQTYGRNQSPWPNLRSNHDKPVRSLVLRSLLSRRPQRACGHVFHLDELLHAEYHANGLRGVCVVHRLHASPKSSAVSVP